MSTQPVKLQLNAEALAALFPEGSTARVELQKAVIAEFTRKHIREAALGTDVQAQIERARAGAIAAVTRARTDAAEKVLQEAGVKKDWGRIQISGETQNAIKETCQRAVRDEIYKNVDEQVKAAAASLQANISDATQLAISRMIDKEIAAAVKAKVDAVVKAKVDAVVKAKVDAVVKGLGQ